MQKIEPAQFENLFEERLQRYDSDCAMVSEEQEEQKGVTSRLIKANTAFTAAREGDTSTKKREDALQSLDVGYWKYKEIVSNLNLGREFYNNLANIVNRFQDDAKKYAYQRRVEAGQIESYESPTPLPCSFPASFPVAFPMSKNIISLSSPIALAIMK